MGYKAHCSQTIYYQYWKCYIQKGIKKEEQYADKARDWEWEYEVCEQNIGNKGNCLHKMLVGSFIKTRILKEQYTDKAWDWEYEVWEQNIGNKANCPHTILALGVL